MEIKTKAISSVAFTVVIVILIIIAAAGFSLYGARPRTITVTGSTDTMAGGASSSAYSFKPQAGQMISNAWVVSAQLGMEQYAISIHAEGLESNGTYIVEGALSSGSMQVVPISSQSMTMNQTSASEFQADRNGTGQYWIVLDSNPSTTFESLSLVYLPGMEMQNAVVVATATFNMMASSSTSV